MRAEILIALVGCLLPVALGITSSEVSKFTNRVTVTEIGNNHQFASNGLPDHTYGPFPSRDNPNSATAQDFKITAPRSPTKASEATCLPMGSIGMAINGVAFYNPYTIEKEDAVKVEVMDECEGHPSPNGQYHYHGVPKCLGSGANNELMGVALDGYPIYGSKDESGNVLTSADLDACHGRTADNGQYQYHITADFPYILGCFTGEVVLSDRQKRNCEMPTDDDAESHADVIAYNIAYILITAVLSRLM